MANPIAALWHTFDVLDQANSLAAHKLETKLEQAEATAESKHATALLTADTEYQVELLKNLKALQALEDFKSGTASTPVDVDVDYSADPDVDEDGVYQFD